MKDPVSAESKKNKISDFSDFYFSSYGHFCSKYCQFSMNFHDNSKNKIQNFFLFVSAHYASFMNVGSKLRVGGLLIVSWDKAIFPYINFNIYLNNIT